MRTPTAWRQLALGSGVRLLLGWREGRVDLDAAPVDLSDEVGTVLRAACVDTLKRIGTLRRRRYAGVPAIDEDEYLSLDLPREVHGQQEERLKTLTLQQELVLESE